MASRDLAGCAIVVSEGRPEYVAQAVEDLVACTGGRIAAADSAAEGVTVLVGSEAVKEAAAQHPAVGESPTAGLTDQGYVVRTVRSGSREFVICAGGGPRGDAYAVIELIKALDRSQDRLLLEDTDRREEPFFVRRGMYAHQHWAYAYPYALRSWEFEDWRRYIDLLAYLRINLFSIWSMCAILPTPLSDGDRRYLENYRAVIDYARRRRGMEVFIGECANNVAESDGGMPIQQRDYFGVEVLKDPSNPDDFAAIMLNRRNLYATANNADGYWIIDSDPGGWEGSPPAQFVDILMGNRELIDELTQKGPDAKLAYWMWMGWGKGKPREERQAIVRETVEQIRDRIREPWVLLPCRANHLDYAAELGYIDKSIFFPYAAIEDEPSPPTTRLRFDEMYDYLNDAIARCGVRSAMGNAQSPLAQLPNIFFFAQTAWNGVPPREPAALEVLRPLARLVAPEVSEQLAQGWALLKEADAESARKQSLDLDSISRAGAGRAGVIGQYYFPNVEQLIRDLALQLEVHAAAVELADVLGAKEPFESVQPKMRSYLQAAIAWHSVHDFRRYTCYGPDVNAISERWQAYRSEMPLPEGYFEELRSELLAAGRDEWTVSGYLALVSPAELPSSPQANV